MKKNHLYSEIVLYDFYLDYSIDYCLNFEKISVLTLVFLS